MVQFFFALAAVGAGAAVELRRLGRQGRRKEGMAYLVLCGLGVLLLGLVLLWKDMPTLYAILSGQYGH